MGWGCVEGRKSSWTGFSFLAPLTAPGSSHPCFLQGQSRTWLLTALSLTKTLFCLLQASLQ